jgi:hypothetical protein
MICGEETANKIRSIVRLIDFKKASSSDCELGSGRDDV